MKWPEGKDFAFTVFDDTDYATLENVREIYSFLQNTGFRTTKSVWPISINPKIDTEGTTCEDPAYLKWHLELQKAGFEIGFHNASFDSSYREDTKRGLEQFERFFGHKPGSMANHAFCKEAIYWGSDRLTGINEVAYNLMTRFRQNRVCRGHVEGDPYFWGDLCKEQVKYVRNFVYAGMNTLKDCPMMPYHDAKRPFVNYWYASSEGRNIEHFNQTIREENQDLLEQEGGACIMYTHFASRFYRNGQVDARFKTLMKRLSQKNGWFVPVSTLLDYLMQQKESHLLTSGERNQLERKWLLHKIRVGST